MKLTEKPRLLCVGHDAMLNRTRRLILENAFDVTQSQGIAEAAAILRETRFELILLCYSLTDDESRAMLQLVHGLSPETRILALGEDRERLPLGVYDVLFQPNGPADLLKRASKMVAARAPLPRHGSRPLPGDGSDPAAK